MKELSVTYYRTSSNGSVGKEKDSRKRQELECRTFSKRNNLKIVKEFYEKGVKGKDSIEDRKMFQEMLSFCEANEIRTILFENASRFSRDLITQETGYRLLTEKGYKLISCDSPTTFIEETPTSKMIRQILGSVSEFEKDNLVSKLRGSRVRKRNINKAKGITTKSGKGKCEGRKNWKELNPELIRECKRLRRRNPKTGKKLSYRKIANEIFRLGFRNNSGNKFGVNQIFDFCS